MRNKNIFIQKQTKQTKTKNPNKQNQTSIEIYQKVRLVIRQLNFSTSNIGKRYLQNESKTLIL